MRQPEFWLPSEAHLAEAIAYAKRLAISEMTEAGIDIVTDGEIGRESYSNHFLCSLDGIYFKEPAEIRGRRRRILKVPRIVGPIRRPAPVEQEDARFVKLVSTCGPR